MSSPGVGSPPAGRSRILAWALWDFGAIGLIAIVATFVYPVYLTSTVGAQLPGGTSAASWLGRSLTIAGVVVAVIAPLMGVLVQAPHRRGTALTLLTSLVALSTCAMSLIRAEPAYFAAGLALLALTTACADIASVPYNSMLKQLVTEENVGRISGLGAGAAFLGSVVLLVVVYVGFIAGTGPTRGLLGIPVADGQNVRFAMVATALCFVIMALPLLRVAHSLSPAAATDATPLSMFGGYRQLWLDLKSEWQRDRNLVYYLLVSAVFRDGLAGIFTFGAVLGVGVYGVSQSDVLIFGVAASTVAATGAFIGGHLDDRLGSKRVIVGSLTALIAIALTMLSLSGPLAFWVCGLLLCVFIGPAQSAARTLLLRMATPGKESVAFGLFTMVGRAAAFLAPWLFFVFVDLFDADRAGLGGICVVLAAGLLGMLAVRVPR